MASFASSATTCGARKHAWTKKVGENNGQLCFVRHHEWRTQARLYQKLKTEREAQKVLNKTGGWPRSIIKWWVNVKISNVDMIVKSCVLSLLQNPDSWFEFSIKIHLTSNKNSATLRSSQGTPMYQLTTYYYGTLCQLHCCTEALGQ